MSNFCNILRYCCIFDTIRMRIAYEFIIFLFIFVSPLTSLFDFFSLFSESVSLSQPMFFLFSQSDASKKKVAATAKRGEKATATSSKLATTAASDSQNRAEKLANRVKALLISDLSL